MKNCILVETRIILSVELFMNKEFDIVVGAQRFPDRGKIAE